MYRHTRALNLQGGCLDAAREGAAPGPLVAVDAAAE